jgi:Ca-activated chloride channel homolog
MKTRIIQMLIIIALSIPAIAGLHLLDTGKVKGLVTDKSTGDPLFAANVSLEQNGKLIQGATTDVSGVYVLNNIPVGTYNIKVSYVGYNPVTLKGIVVKKDQVTVKDISLSGSTNVLSEITTSDVKQCEKRADAGAAYSPSTISTFDGSRYNDNFNTEGYDKINDNEFLQVSDKPLSTFSIDVDVASYANMRRFLNSGQKPPADAVRIEELINYFNYDYPEPEKDVPFSVYMEMSSCPWESKHKLVHIGIQGKQIKNENLPNSNLVFLLDVSGSMSDINKLPLVKKALRLLVNELGEKDHLAVVVYAGASGLAMPSTPCNEKEKILDLIENLDAGGSTAGSEGIKLAYQVAKENLIKGGNNRVILCTDGDFNVGVTSDGELERLIEEKRNDGIFLSVLGFGTGNYQDSKMEKLADKGNGNYSYIDNIMEAQKVLVNEMGGTLLAIAKDVKIQVEFNPAVVKAYRLVGYENRLLADKDFNDDTKDAGELGAGSTVTALYELITSEEELKDLPDVDPLKYQKTNKTDNSNTSETMTLKIRYKEPDGNTSQLLTHTLQNKQADQSKLSNNFKFSAAVASFGMLLRDSKFKGNSNYEDVLALARESKDKDPEGYRSEFIRLVELARDLK